MKLKSAEIETKEARKSVGSTRTVLRKEYKDAIEYLEPSAKVRLLCCAAKLIYLIERWGNWKITLYPLPQAEWIYLRLVDFRSELQKEHSIHCIRAAFKLLEKLGLVLIRKNGRRKNDRNGQDRTYQYYLNRDRLRQVITEVAPYQQQLPQTLVSSRIGNSESHGGNSEFHRSQTEPDRFIVESHTQIPYTDSSTDSSSLKGASEKFLGNVANKDFLAYGNVTTNDVECISVDEDYDNKRETFLRQQAIHEGQSSAGVDGFTSIEERDNFYNEVFELAKHKSGVLSPVSWTGAIMKSIAKGEPCIYLDEFRRGEKVGTCEQREWEIAPGRPYDNFVSYLIRKFQTIYNNVELATQAVFKALADINQARTLWSGYLLHLVNLDREWEKQSALGVSTPYIPPEVLPRKQVSVETAAAALANLVQASTVNAICASQQRFAIAPEVTVSEEPAVALEEMVSEEPAVAPQETVIEEPAVAPQETVSEEQVSEETQAERRQQVLGLINTQNELLKYPMTHAWVKTWVEENSDLVQFNEDGQVVAIADEQEDVTVEATSGTQTQESNTPAPDSSTPTQQSQVKAANQFVNEKPATGLIGKKSKRQGGMGFGVKHRRPHS
ncbi:MAG TPA: hypothetical protein V6C95_22205 [Coleofasciculaceae cyanobacterium]